MDEVVEKLKKAYALTPQEALAEIFPVKRALYIGIPKETEFQEKRIALTPNSVAALTNLGHKIVIQAGAGLASNFEDQEYTQAGAQLVSSDEEIFRSEIIIKTAPIVDSDLKKFNKGQTVLSPILLPILNKNILKSLTQLKITALAYDYIKTNESYFPYIDSMGVIAGSYAILLAGKYLSNEYGKGILLGGIAGQPPCKVLIIGATHVGLAAAQSAIGLGAQVQMFDDNIEMLNHAKIMLGNNLYTSVFDPLNLKKNIARADVVIGALNHKNGQTMHVISDSMVAVMKKGAIIIDTSIDYGGCFETSQVTTLDNPTYLVHGVIHYCVPNITSEVSRTASYALSNLLSPILRKSGQHGGIEQTIKVDTFLRNGVYLYKGSITKDFIAQKFDLKYTNLELLMATEF